MTTKKQAMNQADPNTLPDLFKEFRIGSMLRSIPIHQDKQVPVAGAAANYNLTTLDVLVLPADAKAASIVRASVRAGGSVGEFTPQVYGATPTTTQVAVTPCGDIAFVHTTDVVTDVDVVYQPQVGAVLEATLAVATGVLTLPTDWVTRGVKMLLEAEVTVGTVTGAKIILVPLAGGGAGLPATTKAQLTSNKTTVSFNNATDAPTMARVKCLVGHSYDPNAAMSADATY